MLISVHFLNILNPKQWIFVAVGILVISLIYSIFKLKGRDTWEDDN